MIFFRPNTVFTIGTMKTHAQNLLVQQVLVTGMDGYDFL